MNANDCADRRFESRFRVSTPVFIRVDGKNITQCKALNLSASGVFLESKNLGLSPGEEVELVFSIQVNRTIKLHRRRAEVVFVKSGGTGLIFRAKSLPPGTVAKN